MVAELKYETLEKISIRRPVDRVEYISSRCQGMTVLDIGCFDETALEKRDTEHWLHGRIAAVATRVVGVDNSEKISADGIVTGHNSSIFKGDALNLHSDIKGLDIFDVIVAGELIEHIDSPLSFFSALKRTYPGRELLISTPNGSGFGNTLLGLIGREAQHRDHIHIFSFKILNTLCLRSNFEEFEIIPYRFFATEMILNSSGIKRLGVKLAEKTIRIVEWCFPLLSSGYILKIRL